MTIKHPHPSHEESALLLLKSAQLAARKVRWEWKGPWTLYLEWKDRRFRIEQEERCRLDQHVFIGWTRIIKNRQVFDANDRSPNRLPIHVLDIYRGHCRYCEIPATRSIKV